MEHTHYFDEIGHSVTVEYQRIIDLYKNKVNDIYHKSVQAIYQDVCGNYLTGVFLCSLSCEHCHNGLFQQKIKKTKSLISSILGNQHLLKDNIGEHYNHETGILKWGTSYSFQLIEKTLFHEDFLKHQECAQLII